jgi:CheY-like chemotaxis protein
VSGTGLRVLVVEDNPLSRELLASQLRLLGHEAVLFADGAGALAAGGTVDYDLALVDLRLRGASGFEVAAELRRREDTRRVPIVGVTASIAPEDAARANGSAFDAVCLKPASLAELRTLLERWAPGRGRPSGSEAIP